jgi:membrane-anchored protein YejM (alkaline phosphatase superfamily)
MCATISISITQQYNSMFVSMLLHNFSLFHWIWEQYLLGLNFGVNSRRLKAVLKEVSTFNGKIILLIDSKIVWPISCLDLMT